MKFLVPNGIYKDRIEICKACSYYLPLLGNCGVCKCFMKIKARLAPMGCPKNYQQKTTEIETPDDLPQYIIDEILDMWKDLKTGRAKDAQAKARMIETYNVIHSTNYSPTTNCGSCIATCYDEIKKLYKKYSNENKL